MKRVLQFALFGLLLGVYAWSQISSTQSVSGAPASGQAAVFDGTKFVFSAVGGAVSSVFGRTGAVAAVSGDYSASLVTNSFDKTVANTLTNVTAPATPSAGNTAVYVDSTNKVLSSKNDAGTVSTTVVADTGAANNFLTAVSAAGVISKARPTCANLSDSSTGCSSAAGITALTGDVTASGSGSVTATNVNLPDGMTQAGHLLITDMAAPASPAAAHLKVFGDSTDLRFHDKNAAGTIGTTVVADTGAANNFLTAVSAAGVISKARPACATLSDSSTGCTTTVGTSATHAATDFATAGAAVAGGTCTNQAATAISVNGVPTCTTLTSAYTSGTFSATAHNLLSATHGDTTTASAVRGDGLFSIGAGATWQHLAHSATTGGYFKWNGTDIVASSLAAAGTGACTNGVVATENADAAPTCTTADTTTTHAFFATAGTPAFRAIAATDVPVATATVAGLVPTPPNNSTTFLRGDATFTATLTGVLTSTGVSMTGSAPAILTTGTTPYLDMNTLSHGTKNTCTFALTTSTFTLALSPVSLCTFTLPNAAIAWGWRCAIGWSNVAGTTPTFAVGVTWAQAPTAAGQMANIWTTNTGTSTQAFTATTTNVNILASPSLTNSATVFQATAAGKFTGSATSGTFSPTVSLTGTGATGTAVGECEIQ